MLHNSRTHIDRAEGAVSCVLVCAHMPSGFSHVQLFATLWTLWSPPVFTGFSRQEYWSGLPCPPLGDFPNPEIEPESLTTIGTWEACVLDYLQAKEIIQSMSVPSLNICRSSALHHLSSLRFFCWLKLTAENTMADATQGEMPGQQLNR